MRNILIISFLLLVNASCLFAQKKGNGSIKGFIIEKTTNNPLEFANVVVRNKKDSTIVLGALADKDGMFVVNGLPYGEYIISYSFIGFDKTESSTIALNSKQNRIDVGKLYISETSKTLSEVEVVGQKSTFGRF